MVGLASCSGKKIVYGSIRKGQSVAVGTNKSHKSSHNNAYPKKDPSLGQNSGPEFNEPLNNPNWRCRRSHQGQDTSTTESSNDMPLTDQSISFPDIPLHPKFSSFQSFATKKHADNDERSQNLAADYEPLIEPHRYTGENEMGWGLCGDFTGSYLSANHQFDVVGHHRLHDQGIRRSLDLFRVVSSRDTSTSDQRCMLARLSSADEAGDERFLQMISRKHTLTPDETQGHQLMAALKATKLTPRKVDTSSTSSREASQRLSCPSDQSLPHMGAGQNNFRLSRYNSKDSGFSLSSGSHQDFDDCDDSSEYRPVGMAHHQKRDTNKKDVAFQKLIQRLNGVTSQEKKSVNHSHDSGYEPESLHTLDHQRQSQLNETAAVSENRRPTPGTGRRVNTASDFAVGYWPGSEASRRDRSSDSACGDTHDKYNTLNPKAREFLSFSNKIPNTSVRDRRPDLFASSMSSEEQNGASYPCDATPQNRDHEGTNITNNHFPPPNGHVAVSYINAPSIPILFQPISDNKSSVLGLIPVLSDTNTPMVGPPTGWPTFPMATAVPDNGDWSQPKQFNPYITQNPLFSGLPTANSLPKIPIPDGSNVRTGTTTTTSTLPRRVPKPKHPNPGDQQAYEAWVEWRKATEPGYAMACKLRQQRRAQRNGQKPKQDQPSRSDESG